MVRTALMLATAAAGVALVAPQPAHAQARDRVLIIYGDDKCPESNGEEIVVCRRQPESERYRDPLRNQRSEGSMPRQAELAASPGVNGTGVNPTGVGSCSATGPGGASGCFKAAAQKARQENKEKGEEPAIHF